MKRMSILIGVLLLLGCVSALNAAATIYGISGLIETPDDSIVSAKTVAPMFSSLTDVKAMHASSGWDLRTYGGAIALMPNLEVSAVALDPSPSGWGTEGLVNAKYRVFAETVNKPSLTVGVVDAGKRIDRFTEGAISDQSWFAVVGKNISSMAEGVSGSVSKPIRGTLGFGTGLYKGFFAGLDMSVAPKCSLAVEYLGTGIRNETTFSGCLRYQPIQSLSIEAGALGFESFYAGASYNLSTF